MPKQGKTPKKKSKEKTPQKSGESEYPAMDQDEFNRLFQNAIEQSQAQLQQKHEEQIKRLEARSLLTFRRRTRRIQQQYLQIFISRRGLLLMKPITCHMDFASE